jgi:small basic protein
LNKAFAESMLIAGLYVNLFLALNYAEEASEADNFKHHFHREIIQTLQRFFEETMFTAGLYVNLFLALNYAEEA